jgi:hypothetical protein
LYRLKQSGREWYIEAYRGLKPLGFEPLYSDPSVFWNPMTGQFIGLYVDDMVVLGHGLQVVQATVDAIGALWEVKDLGPVESILGIRVTRDKANRALYIDQSLYVQRLFEKYKLQEAKPITLPITDRQALYKGGLEDPVADQTLYQSAIGEVGWIARGTRWDIAYIVGQLYSTSRDASTALHGSISCLD